jgi:MFS superfamily sulfate permease-like transporter
VLIVAIGIPISMGMAEVAGLPPVIGLYSCLLAPVAFALFGSSRQLVVALDASTAALLAAAVTPLAADDPARQIALSTGVAILVGVVLLLAAVFRAGAVSALVSHPVLLGYQAGLAVAVIATQLPKLLGLTVTADSTLGSLGAIGRSLGDVDVPTAAIGIGCLAAIAVSARRRHAMTAAAVVILIATVAVAVVDGLSGVEVVGPIPSGMPRIGVPGVGLADSVALIPAAIAIAALASADTIVSSRAFADRGGYEVDASADLRGLGVANAASGLSGGITIGASAARTAIVEMVGVRSQVGAIISAALMASILMFFTDPLASLPLTALAAVVIGAVARLVDVQGFRQLRRLDRLEWLVGIVTGLVAVSIGLLQGVVLGVGLAFMIAVVRGTTIAPLFRAAVGEEFRRGVMVARPFGPVVYLNAGRVMDRLRRAGRRSGGAFVLDGTFVPTIDATGALALGATLGELEASGVEVVVAGLDPGVERLLERAGVWSGHTERVADPDDAVERCRRRHRAGREAAAAPAFSDPQVVGSGSTSASPPQRRRGSGPGRRSPSRAGEVPPGAGWWRGLARRGRAPAPRLPR